MGATKTTTKANGKPAGGNLMVRLSAADKRTLTAAAKLRKVSISDYVRLVIVPQAKRELAAADQNIISLTPDEQLEFWEAINAPVKMTPALKKLGELVRGRR